MPYSTQWIEPELFMQHGKVKVYHRYKDGDMDQALQFWYTLCPVQEEEFEFDVRDLPNPHCLRTKTGGRMGEKSIKSVIKDALDKGILQPPKPT